MRYQYGRPFACVVSLTFAAALGLSACNSSSSGSPNPEREHDTRRFTAVVPDEAMLASLNADLEAEIYAGTHPGDRGEASYLIQVPTNNWNGTLVMYAHGYRGEGEALTVGPPPFYRQLIEDGYAWAASSYSANYYDVRAGVEDTNALALAFEELTEGAYGAPSKFYITGHSMGGHVAGAAVEAETLATANNRVEYAAALPMCGVMGDTELFDYFAAWNRAAQHLVGLTEPPTADEGAAASGQVAIMLWDGFADEDPTARPRAGAGEQMHAIWAELSGGPRPVYDQAATLKQWIGLLLGYTVPNGDVAGVLNRDVLDTQNIEYRWVTDPNESMTLEENEFNSAVYRHTPDPNANPIRTDGVRWVPKVNGEFSVPVLTIHTLGDLFVPFSMQQIYAERAATNGSDQFLVQRAIRSPGHCDFTSNEQWQAFQDLAAWEQSPSAKPEGDDVLDRNIVAADNYGCEFTDYDLEHFGDDPENDLFVARMAMTNPSDCNPPSL